MKNRILTIFVILTALFFVVMTAAINEKGILFSNANFDVKNTVPLTDWTTGENDSGEKLTLPVGFKNLTSGERYTLSCTLDAKKNFPALPVVLISAKYCNVTVYLDGTQIYRSDAPTAGFTRSEGVQYLLIQLPENWQGKTLTLSYAPLLGDAISYGISVPVLGERADIVYSQLLEDLFGIVAEIVLITGGVILMAVSLFIRKDTLGSSSGSVLFLGLLSISCGIYMLCQSVTAHLLIQNAYLLYFMEFSMLPLIVFNAGAIMRDNIGKRFRKIYDASLALYLAEFALIQVLNFGFGIEFRITLPLTHLMILLMGGSLVMALFQKKKDLERGRKEMLISVIPLVIGGILDLVVYYRLVTNGATGFLKLGLFGFIILQIFFIYKRYLRHYRERIETETYKELAYKDGLTGLYNRLAYETDIEELRKDTGQTPACLSVDINNLKETNDTLGHAAGDALIQGTAAILKEAADGKGRIYRIGGDEFILLLPDSTTEAADQLVEKILAQKARYNEAHGLQIDFAIGSAVYNKAEKESLDRLLYRADQAMYAEKSRQKQICTRTIH